MRPHAVYKLSARRLPPLEPIPNGATYRAARLWVLLDTAKADSLAEAAQKERVISPQTPETAMAMRSPLSKLTGLVSNHAINSCTTDPSAAAMVFALTARVHTLR